MAGITEEQGHKIIELLDRIDRKLGSNESKLEKMVSALTDQAGGSHLYEIRLTYLYQMKEMLNKIEQHVGGWPRP
jgi:hypothetical protein